ncbi:pericentrin-like [Gossypium australe]|uniref:Pericentrin-like n=1 Tax=Gossypium australe TaxID=47621 RepID=A0A5B6W389_9ROSI|nr:pericentrin-like [Gossypium australe]
MGEAVAQIREAADHLQTLAVRADTLSLMYESGSKRGQSLAWLLRKIKDLGIRARSITLETDEDQPIVHYYNTRRKAKAMDQRYEQFQKDMEDQMKKFQKELKDQMEKAQKDMVAQMTQLMSGITNKGKDPTTSTGKKAKAILQDLLTP